VSDPDFNLLVALDVLLAEASVAGAARRLNLSTSAMSRTLSRLREVTGDPILVRAGRHMVLTPWAEATRDRARSAVHEARAVLQPSTDTLKVESLERLFTIRANDGFVVAFGPLLIAAVASVAPGVCIRFSPKPEKTSRYLREGLVDLEIGVQSNMGPEIRLQRLFQDRFVGAVRKGHPLSYSLTSALTIMSPGAMWWPRRTDRYTGLSMTRWRNGDETQDRQRGAGFPTALSVALASDLIAMVPALYLLNQPMNERARL
jgi:DNA-binding transcriptional LysR family regulator